MRPAWEPLGRALRDHLAGASEATVLVHVTGGGVEGMSAAYFLRAGDEMEDWERAALDACRGRVLDMGAGAGCHTLALQERGHPVVALDACPDAIEVMRARGVVETRLGTTADVDDPPYDTLILLMHGVGITGDLTGLAWLLADAHRLLAPGGSLVLDSRPPGHGLESASIEHALEYEGVRGAPFDWLFLGAAGLARAADAVGWRSEVIHRDPDGRFDARLRRAGEG